MPCKMGDNHSALVFIFILTSVYIYDCCPYQVLNTEASARLWSLSEIIIAHKFEVICQIIYALHYQ